ncbi:MAG: ABC transporter ATP-binding protein [Chloroflexota bacterium]
MPFIKAHRIDKSFEGKPVLQGVSFAAEKGDILCLLGPSGCGKTTLLRIVAGLETADAGQVLCEGQNQQDAPAHRRRFGLMFQDYALFPHKDVFGNVVFGLRMQGLSAEEMQARVAQVLALVGLSGFEKRDVHELSGGEQQRVALARSLAPNPRLLMLDEPLGSLDRALRERLMSELRRILKSVGVTTIYVTHDQQEAFAIADQVLILLAGRAVQKGTPQHIYRQPASPSVARFLGMSNLLPGTILSDRPHVIIQSALGPLQIDGQERVTPAVATPVTVLIRPEAGQIAGEADPPGAPNVIQAQVQERSFRGDHCRLTVRHDSAGELNLTLSGGQDLPPSGMPIHLRLRPEAITWLDGEPDP